jgi:uncharacterized protein (TIGR00369 family)
LGRHTQKRLMHGDSVMSGDRKRGTIWSMLEEAKRNGGSVEDALNTLMYAESPIFAKAGFRVVKLGEGYAEISFPMSEEIRRRGGMVHGGIIMYVLDSVCGLAVISRNQGVDQFTVELKVNFLEQLHKPPFKAVGRIVRMGGRLAVAEGEVADADGKVCAKALGTWYIVKEDTKEHR